MRVREVMAADVEVVGSEASVALAAEAMRVADEEIVSEAGRREMEAGSSKRSQEPEAPSVARHSSSCPNCGMEPEEWAEAQGYMKDGLSYCCEGCAEDRGCVCFHPASPRRQAAAAPAASVEAPPSAEEGEGGEALGPGLDED